MKAAAMTAVTVVVIAVSASTPAQAQFRITTPRIEIPSVEIPPVRIPDRIPTPIPVPSVPELTKQIEHAQRQVRESTTINTNRGNVQASLRAGAYVAFGKEIAHHDYYFFTQAVAASVATGNPGPAMTYLEYVVMETKRQLLANANPEMRRMVHDLERTLIGALNDSIRSGRPVQFYFHGVEVRVGVATYNHWKKISGHYPKINRGRISWDYLERTVPLPNTHQPYVRLRVAAGYR